jgi:hypothetical protein
MFTCPHPQTGFCVDNFKPVFKKVNATLPKVGKETFIISENINFKRLTKSLL